MPLVRTPNGDELFQTVAILRYIGRLAEGNLLYPEKNLVLCSLIDSIMDTDGDIGVGILVFRYGHRFGYSNLSDEAKSTAVNELIENVCVHLCWRTSLTLQHI